MKKSTKTASVPGGLAEAYFRYLETPVRGADGIMRQPASTNFVTRLREVHARENGRQGLSARLRDAFAAGRLYVWSDQHLGHKALENLRGRSAGETDAMMLPNALATVTDRDVLIFGGDIAMTDIGTANACVSLHGHVHGRGLNRDDFGAGSRHVDTSVECIDFKPVPFSRLR